jgi:hypothetical protein
VSAVSGGVSNIMRSATDASHTNAAPSCKVSRRNPAKQVKGSQFKRTITFYRLSVFIDTLEQ